MSTNDLKLQAQRILDAIAFMHFEQCQPLTREFESIPARRHWIGASTLDENALWSVEKAGSMELGNTDTNR